MRVRFGSLAELDDTPKAAARAASIGGLADLATQLRGVLEADISCFFCTFWGLRPTDSRSSNYRSNDLWNTPAGEAQITKTNILLNTY
jgi:hypothetical protein